MNQQYAELRIPDFLTVLSQPSLGFRGTPCNAAPKIIALLEVYDVCDHFISAMNVNKFLRFTYEHLK